MSMDTRKFIHAYAINLRLMLTQKYLLIIFVAAITINKGKHMLATLNY